MELLFENWRDFLAEAKSNELKFIGVWVDTDQVHRSVYMDVANKTAYYTSTGGGGYTKRGDLVQFGGISELDFHFDLGTGKADPWTPKKVQQFFKDKSPKQIEFEKKALFQRGEWVIKNPAGKDVGDLPGAKRNFIAEDAYYKKVSKGKTSFLTPKKINRILKRYGAIKTKWIAQWKIEDAAFPGLMKGKLFKPKTQKSLDPKIQKKINKELELLGRLSDPETPRPQTFKEFVAKWSTKIPGLGRIFKFLFASTVATMVVSEAEEAYAKGGPEAAAKVYADNAADWIPIIGDVKGGVEIALALASYFGEDIATLGGLLPYRSRPDASGEPGDIEDYPGEYSSAREPETPEEEIGPVP